MLAFERHSVTPLSALYCDPRVPPPPCCQPLPAAAAVVPTVAPGNLNFSRLSQETPGQFSVSCQWANTKLGGGRCKLCAGADSGSESEPPRNEPRELRLLKSARARTPRSESRSLTSSHRPQAAMAQVHRRARGLGARRGPLTRALRLPVADAEGRWRDTEAGSRGPEAQAL